MTKEIPLTRGKTAKVDDEDYEMLAEHTWHLNGGYAANAKLGRMHRVLMQAPKGLMVDHVNGDTLDNRRVNLRVCSNSQNQANRRRARGASQFKGVTWQKRPSGRGFWKAQLVVRGDVLYLGAFNTDVDAAAAYNVAAQKHFGDYAHLNDLSVPPAGWTSSEPRDRKQVLRTNPWGFKGVSYDKTRHCWTAQLTYKGVSHLKKRYPTAEAAARAYDTVAREVFGPEAITNF